jgi:septum formation protein
MGDTKPITLYLASRSPRRRELLEQIDVPYQLVDVEVDETPRPDEPPERYVVRVARDKATAGAANCPPDSLVLGADTTVVLDGSILGKPDDEAQALAQLRQLCGRSHVVLTAVALGGRENLDVLSRSDVTFGDVDDATLRAYCATGEPLDKAGSYGIQGRAGAFVTHLSGSYSGVMGLPLAETARLLKDAGFPVMG